jgi:predicted transcriptional regulator
VSAEQLDLVIPGVRRSDPETSLAAANSMLAGAADHRAKILAVLQDGIPRTYVEIAEACGLDPIAVARRMSELAKLGQVRRLAATKPTPSSRAAHLWEAA